MFIEVRQRNRANKTLIIIKRQLKIKMPGVQYMHRKNINKNTGLTGQPGKKCMT